MHGPTEGSYAWPDVPQQLIGMHDQVPGLIVMELQSADVAGFDGGTIDPHNKRLVAVLNAQPSTITADYPPGVMSLQQHPIQQHSVDEVIRNCTCHDERRVLTVPGRTAAVFVEPR